MDGRKSFIFSWNQKHREIHEEALRHFFDSRKKGQKFEYQPKRRPPPKSSTPLLKAQDKVRSSRIHSALPGKINTKDPMATPGRNKALKPLTPPPSSAAADTVPPSERQSSLPKSPNVEGKLPEMRCHVSPGPRDQETKSKEVSSPTTEKTMERKG